MHGLTSEQVAIVQDPRAKQNGGDMAACIQNEYERDYVIEALLNDRLHQKQKYRKKSFDFRRTTKAHEGNVKAAKKRMAGIKEKEINDGHRMH